MKHGLPWILFVATAACSLGVPLLIRIRAQARWLEQNTRCQDQAAQLARLAGENERLRILAAQTRSNSLSMERFHELMRLRGEVGLLRKTAAEKAYAAADLHACAGEDRTPLETDWIPEPNAVLAHWPKDQLRPSGYADHLAALQTSLWAMAKNDPAALADVLTPRGRSDLVKNASMNGGSETERLAAQSRLISDSLRESSGFYVVGPDLGPLIEGLNPKLHVFNVYFAGEGVTRAFALEQLDGDWKLHGIYVSEESEGEPMLGTTLWP
jgi:hypothetical protein